MNLRLAAATLSLGLLLAGCSAVPSANRTASADEAAQVNVPQVVGLDGAAAFDALTAAGFAVVFDAGKETVIVKHNWTIDAQSPTSKAAAGSTIKLTVSKHGGPSATPQATYTDAEIVASVTAPEHWGDCLAALGATGQMIYVPGPDGRFPGTASIYVPSVDRNIEFGVGLTNQGTIVSSPSAQDTPTLATVGC